MRINLFLLSLIVAVPIFFNCQAKKENVKKNSFKTITLEDAVQNYLENNFRNPQRGGKVFCAFDVFGTEKINGKTSVFLWTLCQEFYLEDDKLKFGASVSLPLVLLSKMSKQGYKIVGHREPTDGAGHSQSIKRIFPKKYLKNIHPEGNGYNERTHRLSAEAKTRAMLFYKKILNDDSTNISTQPRA